jgi:hypothetical protein
VLGGALLTPLLPYSLSYVCVCVYVYMCVYVRAVGGNSRKASYEEATKEGITRILFMGPRRCTHSPLTHSLSLLTYMQYSNIPQLRAPQCLTAPLTSLHLALASRPRRVSCGTGPARPASTR